MKASNQRFPLRRVIIVISILILLAIIFNLAHDTALNYFVPVQYRRLVEWGLVLVWCMSGAWTIRILNHFVLNRSVGKTFNHRTSVLISRLLTGVGAVFILLVALNLLQIRFSSLLVGGAVTGVVVGIGAQSTFSNLFAGLILLTLRPFSVGQYITLRTSLFSGVEYGGYVVDVNWFYTVLIDGDQKRVLPNSSVIVSAVTVSSKDNIASHVFSIPLPYSVSEKDLGAELLSRTNGKATIKIREFAKESYTVEIHLPGSIDLGVVRESIAKYQ
ncbi:mechanosensitive ion channel family protein [Alicyclobacillus fodiniaquatilis]|uniref:Mechanosensitive ion channel family protein n=1 Tax=Alicyclobacillus fodiniaquatilis TaxID=1661150 RepID=A0ABW4JIN7_9BACL